MSACAWRQLLRLLGEAWEWFNGDDTPLANRKKAAWR